MWYRIFGLLVVVATLLIGFDVDAQPQQRQRQVTPPSLTSGTFSRDVSLVVAPPGIGISIPTRMLPPQTGAGNYDIPGVGSKNSYTGSCQTSTAALLVFQKTIYHNKYRACSSAPDTSSHGAATWNNQGIVLINNSVKYYSYKLYTETGAVTGSTRKSYLVLNKLVPTQASIRSLTIGCKNTTDDASDYPLLSSCTTPLSYTALHDGDSNTTIEFDFQTSQTSGYSYQSWSNDFDDTANLAYKLTWEISGAPTPVPSIVVDSTTSATQIGVTWTKPSFGNPTSYKIQFCAGASGTVCVALGTANASTFTATYATSGKLTAGLTYRIAVIATNANGDSPVAYSPAFTWSQTPGPPNNLSCKAVNGYDKSANDRKSSGEITCTWKAPTRAVTGYKFTSNVPLPTGVSRTLAANDLTESVTVPYDYERDVQNYSISVLGVNTFGDGTAATATGMVYPLPTAPSSVKLTPDVSFVKVEWVDASVTALTEETWLIEWGEGANNTTCGGSENPVPLTDNHEVEKSAVRTYTVSGIEANTDYCFAVSKKSSDDRNGVKYYATTSTITASEGAPDPPQSVSIAVGALSSDGLKHSVTFSWVPPSDTTNLDGYEIETLSNDISQEDDQRLKYSSTSLSQEVSNGTETNARVRSYRLICEDNLVCTNPSYRVSKWVSASSGVYLMEAPTLTLTAGAVSIQASWTGSAELLSAVSTWDLDYKLSSGSTWTATSSIAKATSTFRITNLEDETSYDLRLRAQNSSHSSAFAEATISTVSETTGGPNSPSNVRATAFFNNTTNQGNLILRWKSAVGGPAAAGYEVGIQTGCAGAWTDTSGITAITYTWTNLSPNTRYCIRVRGYRTVIPETRYSGYVTAERYFPSQPVMTSLLSVIGGFVLNWTLADTVKIGNFELEQTYDSKVTVDDTVNSAARKLRLKNLEEGEMYSYRIRACADAPGEGCGQWSASVSGTVASELTNGPGTPTMLSTTITEDQNNAQLVDIMFSWNVGVNPATEGYEASYQASGAETWTTINNDISASTTSINAEGVKGGTVYTFRVRAFRKLEGEKRYSQYAAVNAVAPGERINPEDCAAKAAAVSAGTGQQAQVGLTLSWTPPNDVKEDVETPTAMVVEWRTGDTINYRPVKLGGTISSYTLPNVLVGQRYDFRLYAEFAFGDAYSDTLVVSIVADLSAGTIDCTAPEDAESVTINRPPEIFDVHLNRPSGDRDEVIVRWTYQEQAQFYELRERLGYQDSRKLQTDGISRADPISGNDLSRVGYAARGHLIQHANYTCPSACWLGIEAPTATTDGPTYSIRVDGNNHWVLAMYADRSNDSYYLVLQGDLFEFLSSVKADWFQWDILTVDTRVDPVTEEVSQSFIEFETDLDPAIADEIYTETIPTGAYQFGAGNNVQRTIIRWSAGGQTTEYGYYDSILRRPTLTTFEGAGGIARATEQVAYVLHGTETWFSVRSVFENNERSGWSAPRHYDATRSALPPPPHENLLPTATPSADNPENTPEDFGTRDFLGALGVGEGALQTQGFSVGLAVAASALVAGAGYFLTPGSNQQARVAILFLLLTTSWIVLAPTVGGLPFSFVAAPLVLVIIAGMIAIFRRAG